jgi:hypothetical protein
MQEQADEEGIVLPATVKEILDTWTYKMGYPVITVTRDYATGGALVTQVYDDPISHNLQYPPQVLDHPGPKKAF